MLSVNAEYLYHAFEEKREREKITNNGNRNSLDEKLVEERHQRNLFLHY